MMKAEQKWTGSIRSRPDGTYYIAVPRDVMRSYVRKLPMEAHSVTGSERPYVIVDVMVTWEGLVHED